jgi:hypothetical protein
MGGRGASLKSLIARYEKKSKQMNVRVSPLSRNERKRLIKAGYFKSNKR